MATTTKSNKTNKNILVSNKEKEILAELHELYAHDYKKYGEHILRESNIPASIKNVYKSLDERQATKRVSTYFRRTSVQKSSRSSYVKRPSRLSNRNVLRIDEPMPTTQSDSEPDDVDDKDQQELNSSLIENYINETDENPLVIINDDYDGQEIQLTEDNPIHQEKQTLSLTNNESMNISTSQSSTNLKSDLLSVRTNIQQALHELDRAISKSDSSTKESNNKQQRLLIRSNNFLTNSYENRKLDDIVRSLSNVVNQQQENIHFIINESSNLLADENNQPLDKVSKTKQQSIKHVLQRLNNLVDRGNSIYDKLEKILSEF
ncbi:unnamed protein product [Rotaria sp. Silwood1]|nr:unnamed protein product [Rotaria sp. Silwood1]CAF1002030.1 unnamed protein product [Rotaria sp. Silwood1]CAF3414988.1 unnamed protein product [Rotaria sp. Silwood1]CAF4534957.1 unnamed protein product [Rotaria sp. Silwood1]